jgi:16S rRNA (guanine966-N2)-methyltransferase
VADGGRVIGGRARGLRLRDPGAGTRPLGDRVKQSLFGALQAEGVVGQGTAFLDLFAGSGAAGIEALSRGAARAIFVERDGGVCAVIGENLRHVGLAGGTVVRASVATFLDGAADKHGAPFDAVLADPPYAEPLLEPALARLGERERGWLSDDGVVVAKHFWRDPPPATCGDLVTYRQRRFGETMLTFYRWHHPAGSDSAEAI